jgi:hypothetical protein
MTMLLDGNDDGWCSSADPGAPTRQEKRLQRTFEILDAVDVPIVLLGGDFTIAGFNRAAADVLSLVRLDIGRSPDNISLSVACPLPGVKRFLAPR